MPHGGTDRSLQDGALAPWSRDLEPGSYRGYLEAQLRSLQSARRRAHELLRVLLPGPIAAELEATGQVRPRRCDNVAVLFCDIVGFTRFCDGRDPQEVLPCLQGLVEAYETLTEVHGLQKIKTIGDNYMAAAGLLAPAAQPVLDCLRCGLGMIGVTARVQAQFQVRVGIHVGPVVCGVLGRRSYGFDLWGDTVNLAARVEKRGQPGSVVLTGPALAQVAHLCRCRPLGRVPIEGKASSVEIYRFVEWVTDDPPVPPPGRRSRRREHR